MADDPISAALDPIREHLAAQAALLGRMRNGVSVSVVELNVVQDRLADDVPRLLAALDAVLKLANEWEASAARPLVRREYAAEVFRAAITRELTGEGKSDG